MRASGTCVERVRPYLRFGIRSILAWLLLHAIVVDGLVAAENRPAATNTVVIDTTDVRGLIRTNEDTIWKLLPRPTPAAFTPADIRRSRTCLDSAGLMSQLGSLEQAYGQKNIRIVDKRQPGPGSSYYFRAFSLAYLAIATRLVQHAQRTSAASLHTILARRGGKAANETFQFPCKCVIQMHAIVHGSTTCIWLSAHT